MKKNYLKYALLSLFVMVIVYIVFAYVNLEPNPLKFNKCTRIFYAFLNLVSIGIGIGAYADFRKLENKQI